MNRNAFLGTLVALPAGLFLVSCGSSNANGDMTGPAAPPVVSGTQDVYTSNSTGSPMHFHTFGIEQAVFASPPANGVSGATSTSDAHTHTVTVGMAELQQVMAGQAVMVTTMSDSSGHTHVFTFVKIA